jgi:hypothetical protein
MKAVLLAALLALCGCAAEAPSSEPPIRTTSVGAPTPLVAPTASTVAPPAFYPSARSSYATPSMPIDNAYHPSWVVHVYGFQ